MNKPVLIAAVLIVAIVSFPLLAKIVGKQNVSQDTARQQSDDMDTYTGGGGPTVSRTQMQAMFESPEMMGVRFQDGPPRNGYPTVVARVPGAMVELVGPPDRLVGVIQEVMVPEQRFLTQMMADMGKSLAPAAPQVAQRMQSILSELRRTGSFEGTIGDSRVVATLSSSGRQSTVMLSAMQSQ